MSEDDKNLQTWLPSIWCCFPKLVAVFKDMRKASNDNMRMTKLIFYMKQAIWKGTILVDGLFLLSTHKRKKMKVIYTHSLVRK